MKRADLIYNPKDYRTELKTELLKRREVWKRVPSTALVFVDHEQQRRYDVLAELLDLLETIGDERFALLQARIIRDNTPPPELF